jgi:hypothetical protein
MTLKYIAPSTCVTPVVLLKHDAHRKSRVAELLTLILRIYEGSALISLGETWLLRHLSESKSAGSTPVSAVFPLPHVTPVPIVYSMLIIMWPNVLRCMNCSASTLECEIVV